MSMWNRLRRHGDFIVKFAMRCSREMIGSLEQHRVWSWLKKSEKWSDTQLVPLLAVTVAVVLIGILGILRLMLASVTFLGSSP